MTVIATNFAPKAAKDVSFDPYPPILATNVQEAIIQANVISPAIPATPVAIGMSPYTPTLTDQILLVDTSVGPVQINMPPQAARLGLELEIKDATGNARNNPISVVMSGAETADGLAPYVIDGNYGGATFKPNDTNGYFVRG